MFNYGDLEILEILVEKEIQNGGYVCDMEELKIILDKITAQKEKKRFA